MNIGLVDACGELIHIFELQIHHRGIYDADECLQSHKFYEFFRSRLPNSIVAQNIDFVLERRMQLFSEISKIPVLLSLLIVVIKDSQGRMPETLYELYDFAIDSILSNAKLRNRAGVERFLTLVAFENHNNKEGEVLKPRRLFETGTVKAVLSLAPELGSLWKDLSKKDEIPLVKTIQRDCQELVVGGGDEWVEDGEVAPAPDGKIVGLYQFSHLSIQEFFFVRRLVAVHPAGFPSFVCQQFLNNELLQNALVIAASKVEFCRAFVESARGATLSCTWRELPRLCRVLIGTPNETASVALEISPFSSQSAKYELTANDIDMLAAVLERRPDVLCGLEFCDFHFGGKHAESLNRLHRAVLSRIEEGKLKIFCGIDFSTFSPLSESIIWDFSRSLNSNPMSVSLLAVRLPEDTEVLSLVGFFQGTAEEVIRPLSRLRKLKKLSLRSCRVLLSETVRGVEDIHPSCFCMTGPLLDFSSFLPSLEIVDLCNQMNLMLLFGSVEKRRKEGGSEDLNLKPLKLSYRGQEVVLCDSNDDIGEYISYSSGSSSSGLWNFFQNEVQGQLLHKALEQKATVEAVSAILLADPFAAQQRDLKYKLALQLAAKCVAPVEVVSALLAAFPQGAKTKDCQGSIPLHWALSTKASVETVLDLLSAFPQGAKVKDRQCNGEIPLHLAAKNEASIEVVSALLAAFQLGRGLSDVNKFTKSDFHSPEN
jgi:hypothetical protein